MALSPITPRDRLQRLVDLARKTLRRWWLIGIFTVAGVGLSLAFAMTRTRAYQSWSTLFYQERIQSSLLQNREDTAQRNIGDRFRELLLARKQLELLVTDPKLEFPKGIDDEIQIDKLRQAIRFESRGANAFRISYTDSDPARAKAVTEKLTKLLQEKDESLRNELAQATVAFALTQKEEASIELRKRELNFTEFLAKHPEFIQDSSAATEGASIRAANKKPVATGGNPRLQALDRQRDRIMARLNASPDAPPVRVQVAPSAEKQAAERQVDEAQRELAQANGELEDALSKYTDKHPTVQKAQDRLATARQKLTRAQAAVPPDQEIIMAPATQQDRDKLKTQLVQLEAQIQQIQQNSGKATPAADTTTNSVVQLETQHADLRRAANEARERADSLADSVFRAQIDANQKLAETGGRLSVIDPAFKPLRPTGTGKSIFLMAGMVLFLGLGTAISIGLAVIDDRIYRRSDIDLLGIPVLATIPAVAKHPH
nr:hypothetical protein [Deltaproteobacteria bacterium]